jgi:hypothetical protein
MLISLFVIQSFTTTCFFFLPCFNGGRKQEIERAENESQKKKWVVVQHVTWPYGGLFGRRRTERVGNVPVT